MNERIDISEEEQTLIHTLSMYEVLLDVDNIDIEESTAVLTEIDDIKRHLLQPDNEQLVHLANVIELVRSLGYRRNNINEEIDLSVARKTLFDTAHICEKMIVIDNLNVKERMSILSQIYHIEIQLLKMQNKELINLDDVSELITRVQIRSKELIEISLTEIVMVERVGKCKDKLEDLSNRLESTFIESLIVKILSKLI